MQSRKQLESFKIKTAQKVKTYKSNNTNKKFAEIVPRLVGNGNLNRKIDLSLGGPFAAVEVMSSLGFEVIERPKDYSYCTDPENSETKKIFKNKNILTNELQNQENEKIPVSNFFSDDNDNIFDVEIEKREAQKRTNINTTNNPSVNIKVDLTEVVIGMANICMPEKNGAIQVDSDFLQI